MFVYLIISCLFCNKGHNLNKSKRYAKTLDPYSDLLAMCTANSGAAVEPLTAVETKLIPQRQKFLFMFAKIDAARLIFTEIILTQLHLKSFAYAKTKAQISCVVTC